MQQLGSYYTFTQRLLYRFYMPSILYCKLEFYIEGSFFVFNNSSDILPIPSPQFSIFSSEFCTKIVFPLSLKQAPTVPVTTKLEHQSDEVSRMAAVCFYVERSEITFSIISTNSTESYHFSILAQRCAKSCLAVPILAISIDHFSCVICMETGTYNISIVNQDSFF